MLAPIVEDMPGLEVTEIFRDAYVLIVPAGDPLAELDRPLEPADLAGRALVSKDCGTPSQRALAAALAELDLDGATAVRAHDGDTVRQLVAQGVGIAVMPRLLVDETNPATRAVPCDHLLPPRRLGLFERADGYRAPAVALAAAILRSGVRELAPAYGDQLEDRGVGLAAALAHRLQAVADAVVAHVVEQRRRQPRARRAERVAERDRAAVGVEPAGVGAGLVQPRERHRGERLADLERADVVDREAGALRAPCAVAGIGAVSMMFGSSPASDGGVDAGDRRQPELARRCRTCTAAAPRRRR